MTSAKIPTPGGRVSALFDGPEPAQTAVVLGHGAGAGMRSDYMETFGLGLAEQNLRVVRFNFLYTEVGRKAPDRQPVLEDTFRAVAEHVRERGAANRLVLGGKSLGGRIASQIAAAGFECDGLVFLGYPLHPPGRPDRMRDAHLRDVKVPMLFVEGTRDPFCPLDTLERVRSGLTAESAVAVIDDGDHSLKVRKLSGRDTAAAWAEAVEAVATWLTGI